MSFREPRGAGLLLDPHASPLNVVARSVGTNARLDWPSSWGYWPATILFFLFACGELVFNGVTTTPTGTAQVMLAYGIVNAVMAPAGRSRPQRPWPREEKMDASRSPARRSRFSRNPSASCSRSAMKSAA